MFDRIFASTTKDAVLKSLDAGMLRNRVISNNIANINTPEFKRVEVRFEDELRNALSRTKLKGTRTDSQHMTFGRKNISDVTAEAYRPVDPVLYSGVNNVDIDDEMAKLAENQLQYTMSLKFLKGNYAKINAAISGRAIQQ